MRTVRGIDDVLRENLSERKHQGPMKKITILALGSVLSASLLICQTPPAPTSATHAKTTTTKASTPPPSAAEIADAKAKGLVWANLNTKVYHLSSAKQYGATKNGKFMSESDAKAAGFRAAKDAPEKASKPPATKK